MYSEKSVRTLSKAPNVFSGLRRKRVEIGVVSCFRVAEEFELTPVLTVFAAIKIKGHSKWFRLR